ncbi:hypothetical protein [Caproiciproducens sp.]
MPRGASKTDEQKLQALDDQISEMESRKAKIDEKIAELNEQKQAIIDEQEKKKLVELQNLINKIGKTPEEIINILKSSSK